MAEILEYLEKHDIAWIPINIDETGGKKIPSLPAGYPSDWIHFKNNPTAEQLLKIQKHYDQCNALAIDTRKVHQVDVDEMSPEVERMMKETPWFPSYSKKYPHFFCVGQKITKNLHKLPGCGDYLTGQWSYCRKDAVVHNSNCSMLEKDLSSITTKDLREITTKDLRETQSLIQKYVPNHSKTQVTNMLDNGTIRTNGHYCFNINKPHRSNHVWFKIKDNKIYQKCYDPDCVDSNFESQGFPMIEEEVQSPFEEFEKTHCKIMNPPCFLREYNNSIQILNKNELLMMYEHMETVGKKPFISAWLHSPTIRTYESMDMLPFPCGVPENTYNLWKGWDVPKHEDGKANKFFEHVRNLIPDRTESQWFIVWLAHIFQKPGKKTSICPVLVGGQGSGKGFLIEQMIGNLMGNKFYHTNDPKNDLFERFCEGRNGKMLVNIDDFNVGILKLNNDPFKSLITGERITYEPKGKAKISSLNCSNFIITTNNSEPVKIETDDRRYALLGCSNKLVNNHDYFDRLSKYWEKPENRWAVFDALRDIDITQINLKKDRPINAMYNEMKTLSADKELLFLGQLMNARQTEYKNLYQTFTHWLQTNGFSGYTPRNSISFGKYILKIDGVSSRQSHGTVYIFDHKIVGEYLAKKGIKVDGVFLLYDDADC